jgi:hypothetical protein
MEILLGMKKEDKIKAPSLLQFGGFQPKPYHN